MKCKASGEDETCQGFSEGGFLDLKLRGKILLAFHMVSTGIKYKMLCHAQAMWQFHHELHDMVCTSMVKCYG